VDELFDAPVQRILLVLLQPHGIRDFTVANQICNIRDGGQRVSLGGANALDQLYLFGLRGLLPSAPERIVESVVLAENVFDRRLASQQQSHGGVVHLHRESVLDVLGPMHPLVSFIQELALTRHFRDRLQAHGAHADHQ
jgi:hypothetical protein